MANTGQRQPEEKVEKKDQNEPDKAKAGASGKDRGNTQAGSGSRGGHRKRKSGPPEGRDHA
jgi:hypothetical protein